MAQVQSKFSERTAGYRSFRTSGGPDPSRPLVGVVILDYNGLNDSLRCLASLREQDYGNLAVYVIDNASRENNAATIANTFGDAIVTRNSVNLGFGGGANQGMKDAIADGAEFVLFLNNDTICPEDLVSKLVRAMISDSAIGICGPKVLSYGSGRIQNLGYTYNPWFGIPAAIGAGRLPNWTPVAPTELAWLMGCALLVRRDVLRKTGGFDPDFFLYWEDHYLCWQAKQLGYGLSVVYDAAIEHRKTVGSEFSKRHVYHMFFGQIVFAAKTAEWWRKPTLVIGMSCIAFAYTALALVKRGSFVLPVIYEAIADFYSGHPKRHVSFSSVRESIGVAASRVRRLLRSTRS